MPINTPVEIMALIFVVVASIKILVLLASPKSWAKLVKKVWSNSQLVTIMSLILAAVSLYFLIQELSIVQIFAVMLFISLLAAVGIAAYSNTLVNACLRLLKDRELIKKSWIYMLIWIALLAWAAIKLYQG